MSDSTWNQQTQVIRAQPGLCVKGIVVPVPWQYAIAITLLSVFRLGGLTHQSLWFDEGYTLNLVSVDTFSKFLKIFGSYTTSEHLQPLYYFIMFLWSRVAGVTDTALRLPSAAFSIASGICLFAMLRLLTTLSTKAYAMLGVGLFAVSSYSVYYAQEARPYACVQFFSFLLILAWMRQSRQQYQDGQVGGASTILLAFACVLACMSSIFGSLLVFSLASADLFRSRRQVATWWKGWSSALIASAVFVIAYGVFAVIRFPSVIGKDIVAVKQPLWMNAAYAIFGTLFGTTVGPSTAELRGSDKIVVLLHSMPVLLPAGLIVITMIWAIARIVVSSPALPHYAKVAGLAALVYGGLLFLGFGVLGKLNVLPRHASALFALGVVLLASCVISRGDRIMRIPRVMLLLCLTGVFVLNSVSLIRGIYAPSCRKDDYRAAAAFVSQQTVPVFLTSGQMPLLQHYGATAQSVVDVNPYQLSSYLPYASGRAKQIIVVTNTFRNYRWDNAPSVQAVLQPAYLCREEDSFAYFQVMSCKLRTNYRLQVRSIRLEHAH